MTRWIVFSALALAACGGTGPSDDGTGPGPATLTLPLHQLSTDTVLSYVGAPFVVNVAGSVAGRRSGIPVRFEALSSPARPAFLWMGTPLTGLETRSTLTDTTDSNGKVAILLLRGTASGHGVLTVTVPALGLSDTAGYSIDAGLPTRLTAAPADTALHAGAQYIPRVQALDVWNNPVNTTPGLSSDSAAVVVSAGALRAQSLGRASVSVRVGPLSIRIWASVVPPGTLAVFRPALSSGERAMISIEATDGTGRRDEAFGVLGYFESRALAWAPDGNRVIYHGGQDPALFWVDNQGTVTKILGPAFSYAQLQPAVSRDGQFIYFSAVTAGWTGGQEIWRMGLDGSAPMRVGPAGSDYSTDAQPSPSPDGSRVAFTTDRRDPSSNAFSEIAILDPVTGTFQYTGTRGLTPRWSPNGQLIAYYYAEEIRVMRPDGTGQRAVSLAGLPYGTGLDWSADGQWIVARNGVTGMIDLISEATGLTVPLPFTRGAVSAAWKP